MAPTKRKKQSTSKIQDNAPNKPKVKRMTKAAIEKSICRKKLEALEQEESKNSEDRFSFAEKKILLNAYNERGFTVFQDMRVLQPYLPNRSITDLKGLIQRLEVQSPSSSQAQETRAANNIDEWQTLCQQLLNSLVKDRKINIEDSIPEALTAIADDLRVKFADHDCDIVAVDYSELVKSFAQLVSGKFPNNMTPVEARLSIRLFEHVCSLVESLDIDLLQLKLGSGRWLGEDQQRRHDRAVLAQKGLDMIDGKTKKCPTVRDFETDKNIEALCLELPKVRRATDMLNPLCINESMVSSLIDNLESIGCKSQELLALAMSGDN